ncbi:MAG: nicotinate-nucleotide adenylyltransferase [Pirellulales bacterium]|nr:nicotinate-nucleotide adenylyltransferase [Pirellulales bacterium]
MRLGIFGGSFDPVHYGHLLLAESSRQQARLDRVYFVPANIPPHKLGQLRADGADRVEMLKLAISGQDTFAYSTCELDRGGISYTVETLRYFHKTEPAADLFLLLGADSLHDLPNWKEPAEICTLALPLVVNREGHTSPDWQLLAPFVSSQRLKEIAANGVVMPGMGLSSSQIRQAAAAGSSIRYQTPRAVELYLITHKLYGA